MNDEQKKICDLFLEMIAQNNFTNPDYNKVNLAKLLDAILNKMGWLFTADQKRYLIAKAPSVAPNIA